MKVCRKVLVHAICLNCVIFFVYELLKSDLSSEIKPILTFRNYFIVSVVSELILRTLCICNWNCFNYQCQTASLELNEGNSFDKIFKFFEREGPLITLWPLKITGVILGIAKLRKCLFSLASEPKLHLWLLWLLASKGG